MNLKLGKCFRVAVSLLLLAAMTASFAVVGFADGSADDAAVSVDGTYSVSLPSYDGAVLITAQLKKNADASDAKMVVYGENEKKFLEADVAGYINSSSFTDVNLIYFKYSGKYAIYTGALSGTPVYRASGVDGLTHAENTDKGGVNETYDVALGKIDFVSEGGMQLKGFGCYEIMREYDSVTSLVDVDYTNYTDSIGEIITDVDSKAKFHQTDQSETVTRDGAKWNKYYNNGDKYSQFSIVQDPAESGKTALKMLRESGDQRLTYATAVSGAGNTNGNNVKASFCIYLPSGNTGGKYGQVSFMARSGYAYQVIKFYKNSDSTYTIKDAEEQTVFSGVPSERWLDFEIDFDIDAQKYVIYYGGKSSAERLLRLSKLVNTSEKNAGRYMGTWKLLNIQMNPVSTTNATDKAVFYFKNVKVGYASSDDMASIDFSKLYTRNLLNYDEEALKAALENIKILNADTPQNGITLDAVTGSGTFNNTTKTYENTYSVEWTSSNPAVISNTGVVHPSTAKAETVTMTAKAIDPSGNSKTKDFTINVPKVMPYDVNEVEITGADGVTDNRLVGGKTVSAVKLTRYAQSGSGAGVVIAALYDGEKLADAAVNPFDDSAVKAYSDGKVNLTTGLALPAEIKDTHKLRVFIFDSANGMKPMAELYETGKQKASVNVYLCGDSTVSPYNAAVLNPQLGWGEKLGGYLNGATVVNKAIPGKSARSFVAEGDFTALDSLQNGDYVIVQFGHNDQGQQRPVQAGTVNLTSDKSAIDYAKSNTYVRYLQMYVDKAREKGASVIFVTSPNRATDTYPLANNIGDYPAAMKLFAAEKGIPCFDLNAATIELFNMASMKDYYKNYYLVWGNSENQYTKDYVIEKFGALGSSYAKDEAHKDYTHFNPDGADVLANIVAGGIAGIKNSLSGFVKTEGVKTLEEIAKNPPKMPTEADVFNVKAVSRANGVSLTWDKVEGASSYAVYRDNAQIATVGECKYDDRYFRTLENLLGEVQDYPVGITADNIKSEHRYYVTAGGKQSKTITAKAATEKLAYFTMSGTTVLDKKNNLGLPKSKGFRSAFANDPYAMFVKGGTRVALNGTSGTTLYSYEGYKRDTNAAKDYPVTYFGDYAGKTAYGEVFGNLNYTQVSAGDATKADAAAGKTTSLSIAYNGSASADGLLPKAYAADSKEEYTVLFNAALENSVGTYNLNEIGLLGKSFIIDGGIEAVPELSGAEISVTVTPGKYMTVTSFKDAAGNALTGKNKWATYIADVTVTKRGSDAYGDDQISVGNGSAVSFTADGERYGIYSIAVVKKADYIK